MAVITFKPKQVTKRLLSALPERAREVIIKRFGLGDDTTRMTLEAIGEMYGITRERVRQIENAALGMIRKSEVFEKEQATLEELRDLVVSFGGVVSEEDFLASAAKDESSRNHIHLLLVLGQQFKNSKEDAHFKHQWTVDEEIAGRVNESLKELYTSLSDDDLIPESDFIRRFLDHLKDISEQYKDEEIIKRWLTLSKTIGKNPLGEWGVATSPNVRARGMRDYAYLVIRHHGSPMHFREVAKAIEDVFRKKAHVATCHNELIKDERFVLVGRGLYALAEWGYEKGVVKNVIRKILEENGPMTRDEIIQKVLKERYVKENTILVNLQDSASFRRDKEGRYHAAGK